MNLVLRLFGVRPEEPAPVATWQCPTCGYKHPVGTYRLGRVVPNETVLREAYENDEISADTFARLMGQDQF